MIRDVDKGAKRLLARLRGMESTKITVGVHAAEGDKPHPSGGTVGELAVLLELGTDRKAPLGFLRNTIDENRSRLAQDLADAGTAVLDGDEVESAFGGFAKRLRNEIRLKVPVDTKTLRKSVRARVNGEESV